MVLSVASSNTWVILQESSDNVTWNALFDFGFGALTKSGTKSLSKSKYYRLRIASDTGVTFSNLTIKLQLEKGSTATDYEPYGVQPSPDYPSEIRSVTELGQNLLKLKSGTETADGVTFTYNEDGSVTLSGTAEQGNHLYLLADLTNAPIVFKGGSYYTQSITVVSGSFDGISFTTFAKGETNLQVMNNNQTRTFGEDCTVIRTGITFVEGTVLDCTFFVQIERGDKATTWKPYGYVPVEVKVEGKNKFNKNSLWETGRFLYDTGEVGDSSNFAITNFIEIEPNTNYIAWGTSNTGSLPSLCFYDSGKTFISSIKHDSKNPIKFTTPKNCKYIRESVLLPEIDLFVIEKGSIATEYVPYVAPKTISLPLGDIQLRSTPDGTRDTFARVDGVWNKVEKITPFTITENMVVSVNLTYHPNSPLAQVDLSSLGVSEINWKTQICLMPNYKELITTGASGEHGMFSTKGSKDKLQVLNKNITDLATAKTILAGETGIIKRDTPTYTPITDQALTSALDELEQLILHKGYNYITATSVNGVKAQLDLSYIKDINTVLNNITAMIATIGGELNV